MLDSFYLQLDGLFWITILIAMVAATVRGLATDDPARAQATGGVVMVVLMIVAIGLRPVDFYYVDMLTYARVYQRFVAGYWSSFYEDWAFDLLTVIAALAGSVTFYFLLCAAFYIVPQAIAVRQMFGTRWPMALAVMASSFSFYAYGTNGIRNGIAVAFALLVLATPKLWKKLLWAVLAAGFHFSVMLTFLAHAVALAIRSVPLSLGFWVLSIPAAILLPNELVGNFVESIGDTRSDYFTSDQVEIARFRWDFIVYSAAGTAAIIYWKYVRGIEDEEFDLFASTYLIANGGWILVNDVLFSNRFAYLSWFMIELVILFPMLRNHSARATLPLALVLILLNAGLALVLR